MNTRILTLSLSVGVVLLWVWLNTEAQRQTSRVNYVVQAKMRELVVLPCPYNKYFQSTQSIDGRSTISVSVDDADDIPLNYNYTVSGGRLIGQGPTVVWDFTKAGPGKYSIVINVDDGVGRGGSSSKTITVIESPVCDRICECPDIRIRSHNTQVRPGDNLDFEVLVGGGEFYEPKSFTWKVENGTIIGGQSTPSITVSSSSNKSAGEVKALVTIGGTIPSCNCPVTVDTSVPIWSNNFTQTFEPTAYLLLDESALTYPCPAGGSVGKASKDMIASVSTVATGNRLTDQFEYEYRVTGGRVVGSGAKVDWDMTDVPPGTYEITATARDRDGRSVVAKRSMIVAEADCGPDLVECASISLATPVRIRGTDDYIVRAHVKRWAGDSEISNAPSSWRVTGGSIIAGQGTNLVRVRARWRRSDPAPSVTFALVEPEEIRGRCPAEASVFLSKSP